MIGMLTISFCEKSEMRNPNEPKVLSCKTRINFFPVRVIIALLLMACALCFPELA